MKLRFDVGFGDVVSPEPEFVELDHLLDDQPPPRLSMYRIETMVAEKFETIVSRGIDNSRLKDYYDIWAVLRDGIEGDLKPALRATFARRQTALHSEVPAALTDSFAASDTARLKWEAFLRKGRPSESPEFGEVVALIRERVLPLVPKP